LTRHEHPSLDLARKGIAKTRDEVWYYAAVDRAHVQAAPEGRECE
jgi:hypothetical protein